MSLISIPRFSKILKVLTGSHRWIKTPHCETLENMHKTEVLCVRLPAGHVCMKHVNFLLRFLSSTQENLMYVQIFQDGGRGVKQIQSETFDPSILRKG